MYCSIFDISYLLLFSVPSEPQSVEIVSINSSSVTLQWRPPKIVNGVIAQYSIMYNELSANFGNNMLMGTIEGLSPDTVYVLQLRAHTGAGAGASSNRTIITRKFTYCCVTKVGSLMIT